MEKLLINMAAIFEVVGLNPQKINRPPKMVLYYNKNKYNKIKKILMTIK